eukprot:jgi/Astpho2/3490/e_gw1.00056.17.1_t
MECFRGAATSVLSCCSAYVPEPRGILHEVSALVKEVWLLCVLVGIARGSTVLRLAIAGGCALLSIVALEGRLWRPQLFRLGLVSALVFAGAVLLCYGVPPVTEVRHMPGALQGLGSLPPPEGAYRYVLFNPFIVTVTTRSLRLAAATASLSFVALQSASLVLTTTPAEELALAVSTILMPLQFIGIPAKEIGLTLLLSLRFMALVFDEVRNLCLGLAARNIQWRSLGPAAGLQISAQMFTRLFGNLMQRSESIATSMQARGFVGPDGHEVHLARVQKPNIAADVAALALLAGSTYAAQLLT